MLSTQAGAPTVGDSGEVCSVLVCARVSPIVANGYVYAGITNSSSNAEVVAYGLS